MGKNLIIKGADFAENAIIQWEEIDLSSQVVKHFNIGQYEGSVHLAPASGSNPSFYEVIVDSFNEINITPSTVADGVRMVFTNSQLSESVSTEIAIDDYLAGTKENSYFHKIDEPVTIALPANTAYIYIRKTTSTGTNTTPSKTKVTII